ISLEAHRLISFNTSLPVDRHTGYMLAARVLALSLLICTGRAMAEVPLLIGHVTGNHDSIVFESSDSLWSVARSGGEAKKVEGSEGESSPSFSPNGEWLASSRAIGGNVEIYVRHSVAGTARRLTYDPHQDLVRG